MFRWVLPLGVGYIVMFEGVFANIDFMVRRLTVLWYARILSERWLGLHVGSWAIDLSEAPGGNEALWTLLAAAAVLGAAGLAVRLAGNPGEDPGRGLSRPARPTRNTGRDQTSAPRPSAPGGQESGPGRPGLSTRRPTRAS